MKCSRCNTDCDREEVDIGVGVQYGPWQCNNCGWKEGEIFQTTTTQPPQELKTVEEAKAFQDGFNAGVTAYAAKVGHSGLRSKNPDLVSVMDEQGWKTIELFEKLTGRTV